MASSLARENRVPNETAENSVYIIAIAINFHCITSYNIAQACPTDALHHTSIIIIQIVQKYVKNASKGAREQRG